LLIEIAVPDRFTRYYQQLSVLKDIQVKDKKENNGNSKEGAK
jgi:hypothetical protein